MVAQLKAVAVRACGVDGDEVGWIAAGNGEGTGAIEAGSSISLLDSGGIEGCSTVDSIDVLAEYATLCGPDGFDRMWLGQSLTLETFSRARRRSRLRSEIGVVVGPGSIRIAGHDGVAGPARTTA